MRDPKDPGNLFRHRTLWLDQDTMVEARERFWAAYEQRNPTTIRTVDDKHNWDLAWAAGISAYLYMAQGQVGPSEELTHD